MSKKLTTNVDERALHATKFPPEFSVKVDMSKVNVDVLKKWIGDELTKILGTEDDIVIELVFNQLQESNYPNIKKLQISLAGFLDKDAPKFCKDLWTLCISAQANDKGIPQQLLEAKKQELLNEREEEGKAREEAIKREQVNRERERDLARTRAPDSGDRSRARGGRYRRDFNSRPPLRSRSPPPQRRRDDDDFYRRSNRVDSYKPAGRGPREEDYGRRRSRSRTRSRSPPPRKRRHYESYRSPSPPPRSRRHRSPSRSRSASRTPPRRRRHGSESRSRSPPRRRARDTYRDDGRGRYTAPRRPRAASPTPPPRGGGSEEEVSSNSE